MTRRQKQLLETRQSKECCSPQFSVQKLNYICNKPVEAGIVEKPKIINTAVRGVLYRMKEGLLEVDFL